MIVSFTGHRPNKLGGYEKAQNKRLIWALYHTIEKQIEDGAHTFISGMALGIDTWAARCVIKLKEKYPHIKLVCAIPCANHSAKWKEPSQKEWQWICDQADKVIYVSDQPYTHSCMQERNIFMVDNSDLIIAIWDGTNSGTGNCIRYAQKHNKPIIRLDPTQLRD